MFFHFSKAQSAVSSSARKLGETIAGYVTAKKGKQKKEFPRHCKHCSPICCFAISFALLGNSATLHDNTRTIFEPKNNT